MEKQITTSSPFYLEDMALRDQPYMPLYVQDFLTDEKLNECSASTTGVYIKIMCLMHKSENYGTILLKQKDKQKDKQIENFALKLAKLLPFSFDVISDALRELLEEKVLQVDGDFLQQKRMIEDGDVSLKRSNSGREGGKSTQKNILLAKSNNEANGEPNPEYDIENESEGESVLKLLNIPFEDFWNLYDKKVGEKEKLSRKWASLKNGDREAAMKHIPGYKIAQPDKTYRKNPSTYLNNKSWNDELIYSKNGQNGTHKQNNLKGIPNGIDPTLITRTGIGEL